MGKDKKQKLKRVLKILAPALLLAVPLFLAPQTTHALSLLGGLDFSPAGIATGIFRVIAYVFNFLFGLLYLLGSYLVQVALQVNDQILNGQNQIVTIGWTILRDVANLGFVLVMIIVAVATIIRYEKFSAKALLPKLIAAAIIVNFSLTIAGAFIVFANSLTQVFLAGKLGNDPATAISVAFQPQALYLPPQNPPPPNPADQGSAASGFGTALLTGIAGLVFSMVFTLIAALVMFALALMLIIRYVFLSILLLTAPITWLFWVFPPLSDIFHTWWKKFMQWVFFLPAVAFFIYLALTSVQFFDGMNINTATAVGGTLGIVFDQGIKMILLCGLMLGGLIVAQNMGIAGAAGAMKIATGARKSVTGWAKNKTTGLAQRTGRRMLTGGVDEKGKTTLQRWGESKAGKIPLIGAALTGLAGASVRAKGNNKKDLDEAQKKTEGRSGEEASNILNRQITGGRMMTDAELAAWGIKAGEKQKWNDIDPKVQDRIIAAVKRTSSEDKLLGSVPHLYGQLGIAPQDVGNKVVGKYIQDASKLDPSELRYQDPVTMQYDNNIAINLRNSHIAQLGTSGNDTQRQAVVDAVKAVLGNNLNGIESALNQLTAAKSTAGPNQAAAIQNAKNVISQIQQNLTPEQKKAMATYQNIQNNANWAGVNW